MDPIMAMIFIFGGNYAPRGFAYCDGTLLAISANSALFSLLGTTYGGNGVQTFGLPELRGRVPLGAGQRPGFFAYALGQNGGSEYTTLTIANMPAHTHVMSNTLVVNPAASDAPATTNTPSSTVAPAVLPKMGIGPGAVTVNGYATPVSGVTMAPGTVTGGITAAITGGSQSFSTMMPYQVMNYLICIQGVYPSRN